MPSSNSTLEGLLIQNTEDDIYTAALAIAVILGLPVTSWQPGDPTRSLYHVEAETLATLETEAVGFIQSGFLDFALGQWLVNLAKQVYNVDVPGAISATTPLTLTNAGGAIYIIDPGDLTFKASSTGKTYHNTEGGTLDGSAGTLTVQVIADEAGSASSAGPGQIDTLVTTLLGVTCSNAAAAVGIDQQDPSVTVQQCRDKLGSLSPDGPASAYSFVARNSALTGINTVTRARVYPTSDTGDVLLYVAGASGAVGGSDVTAVQNAIVQFATPLTITPTVLSANNVSVAVTYTIWIYKSVNQTSSQIEAAILTALETLFSGEPIGGDIIPPAATGTLYATLIESAIRGVFPKQTFRVLLSAPGDTALTNGQVAVLGSVTPTVNIISDPQ
jgi:hypothetical protein